MKPKLEYLKKNFDEIAILGVITKITLGKYSELTIDDEPVIQALRRYKTDFSGASLEEMGEYFSKMDSDSISKAINNIQGILHEIEWVNIENSDGDSIMVGMFPETNHEDYDIWAIDTNTGEMWTEQLKATMDKSTIRDWIEEHPDGTIRVDEEMAEELVLPTTGLDRDDLRTRIDDVVEKLKDSADDDTIWDYLPALGGITMASIVWSLYQEYKNGIISDERFKALVVRATGLKIAKIATLMLLLSIPVVNVITGTAMIYRLISAGQQALGS
jgi:hypothetical protein